MAFTFHDLDDTTRRLMLDEIALDEATGLVFSTRLTADGVDAWLTLLREACERGDEASLTAALGVRGGPYLETYEFNPNTGIHDKLVPTNAASVLAESEFNRFYIRALCLRAIEEGRELEVYRARRSNQEDPDSQALIGTRFDPVALLNDLRTHQGVGTALGLPRVNSGLSVRLV